MNSLLSNAATLYWLRMLVDAAKENSPRLKQWLVVESPVKSNSPFDKFDDTDDLHFTMVPTPDDLKIPSLKYWLHYQTMDDNKTLSLKYGIAGGWTDPQWSAPNRDRIAKLSRLFVASRLNQLNADIRPRLSNDFKPVMVASKPWQAMCLALYEDASGESIARKCGRPQCGQWISLIKVEGERKKYTSTKWGSNACKQWNYDQDKRSHG